MVKFRTRYNPGDYNDYEHYEPGTSLTEEGQAETMEQLMERLTRTPVRPISYDLEESEVDAAMEDADLDEFEDEGKTGMATALSDLEDAFVANQSEAVASEKERAPHSEATTNKAAAEQVPVSHLSGDQANSDDAA